MANSVPVKFPTVPEITADTLTRLALLDGTIRNAPLRRIDKAELLSTSGAAQASIRNQDFVSASIQLNNLARKVRTARLPESADNKYSKNNYFSSDQHSRADGCPILACPANILGDTSRRINQR
jgi:hypothetical protein